MNFPTTTCPSVLRVHVYRYRCIGYYSTVLPVLRVPGRGDLSSTHAQDTCFILSFLSASPVNSTLKPQVGRTEERLSPDISKPGRPNHHLAAWQETHTSPSVFWLVFELPSFSRGPTRLKPCTVDPNFGVHASLGIVTTKRGFHET